MDNSKENDKNLDSHSQLFPEENLVNLDNKKELKPNDDFELKQNYDFHFAPLFVEANNKTKSAKVVEDKNYNPETLEVGSQKISSSTDESICQDADDSESKDIETKVEKKAKTYHWAIDEPLRDVSEEYDQIETKAVKYSFELDDFQKQAILHLDKGESVFVSAHTSAGKTVIAEYAIALSISHQTRAIYTSPIKTLSNQKFRDFKKAFGDVGIITGDVSINPDASCLILTTEIFRSILYKGSEIIRSIEWIIFDEVHYINDYERGVVWEEVIIMLPDHINIILLSATVPNALEFADWVGFTKKKKIYVISTLKRPVPLRHLVWHRNRFHTIRENEKINDKVFADIMKIEKKEKEDDFIGENYFRKESNKWKSLIKQLGKQDLLPVVIFVFSKKRCDMYARMISNNNFNNRKEKDRLRVILKQAFNRLTELDRQLPQIKKISHLLENGIGIHHAGMLPIVKELVEICFASGLVKVLFATETFALGVNMPARTVIFDKYQKHDGRSYRYLLPGEYIQMSGRAGRRGIDKVGTVILIAPETFYQEKASLIEIISGKPTRLESKFRITFNMILNLFNADGENVEAMINKSFEKFHSNKVLDTNIKNLQNTEDMLKLHQQKVRAENVELFFKSFFTLEEKLSELTLSLLDSDEASKDFTSGAIVYLKTKNSVKLSPAVLVKYIKSPAVKQNISFIALVFPAKEWNIDEHNLTFEKPFYCYNTIENKNLMYLINEIKVSDIFSVTFVKLKLKKPSNILIKHDERLITKCYEKIKENFGESLYPNLPGIMKKLEKRGSIKIDVSSLSESVISAQKNIVASEIFDDTMLLDSYIEEMKEKLLIKQQVSYLKQLISNEDTYLLSDFEKKVLVLKKLSYINDDRAVTIKGKVAREINNCDSLIMSEMIFQNVLTDLLPEEILSLVSPLMFEIADCPAPHLTERQEASLINLISITESIAYLQQETGIEIDIDKFLESNINHGLMEVVYKWAQGHNFSEICLLTDCQEGVIVRHIVRLDEACRDLKTAAQLIGDPVLYQKMEAASAMIKRDIVFTASLYLV